MSPHPQTPKVRTKGWLNSFPGPEGLESHGCRAEGGKKPFDPNKCYGQVTGGWGRKGTSNIFWIIPLDIFSGPKMEGPEALHQLMKSGVSLVGFGGEGGSSWKRLLGADPIPSYIRPADQPGSPRPQLARGRLLPGVPQSGNTLLVRPRTPPALAFQDQKFLKQNLTQSNNTTRSKGRSPVPGLRSQQVSGKETLFPGLPAVAAEIPRCLSFRVQDESLIELRRLGA